MQYGPGFAATFLYYFVSTAFVFTLVTMKGLGVGLDSGFPQQMGLVGGLVFGLIGGYFNRTITLEIPVKSKKVFLQTLKDTLSTGGYQEKASQDDVLVFERAGLSKLLSGKIYVKVEDGAAMVASRAVQMRGLRKQFLPEGKG